MNGAAFERCPIPSPSRIYVTAASTRPSAIQQCAGAFGKTTLPIEFQIGKEKFEFQNASQSLILPASTIYALRFCLSYLARPADWSKEDYFLRFTAANEQLQIDGRSQKVFCPARGSWSGIATVSAREFISTAAQTIHRYSSCTSIRE
jgi:hypothetical protein